MLLLAQRQEAGGCEELPLLNFTPGSYEVRHMPMKSFDLSDRKNLARSVKVVSTEVLPSVCMHGGRLTDLGNGRRVLLVEDNEFNCDLAEELLSALGVYVTVAVNGRECVERVAAEPFDLVLMDIQMPLMDGLTAARAIRADGRFDGLPIVALTGRSMTGDREGSLSAGMNDHLTKPIDPDMLSDMLIRWLPERLTSRAQMKSQITTPPGLNEKLPALLPPFDIQAALVRANGKPELLRRMMLRFRDLYEQSGHELRTMIDGGRIEEAHRFAHSLKGVASTLEAHTLAACAAAIEYALRDGMMGVVPRLIQAMDTALAPAIAAAATLEVATVELPSLERQMVSLPFVSKGSSRAPLTAGGQSRSSHSHSW
jgi:CheY-like chemotaxis protein